MIVRYIKIDKTKLKEFHYLEITKSTNFQGHHFN